MAKFLFIVVPALGHINPTLAVASELKKRGHSVGYATGRDVQYSIESEGFDFFTAGPPGIKSECGKTAQKVLKYRGLIGNYYFFRLLLEATRRSREDVLKAVQNYQPDVLIVDSITLAGGDAAELSGLPWATCSAVAGLIPTNDGPPFTQWGLPPSDNGFVKMMYGVIRYGQKIFMQIFDRELNKFRASIGLSPAREGVISTTLSPYLILIFTIEGFEYKRSDWPKQAHLIGPSPWGKSIDAESSYEWIDELPREWPVIYVTLGTFQVFRTLNFFEIVIEAFKNEPCQIVMSVGPAMDIEALRKLAPAHFRVERFVPQEKILPRASAVIHHGGQGIAQDSIYHGLPAVVIPVSQDLPEIARRCEVAGVALRIPYSRLTPSRLRENLCTVLQSETIKHNTKKLQTLFLSTAAGKTGADLLERLAKEKHPIYCEAVVSESN